VFFLEKGGARPAGTKKLSLSGHGPDISRPWPENKSLLLLFFRKEDLSILA
jgi:hypothetical protein